MRKAMLGCALACALLGGATASAQSTFSDDFEGDLARWVGQGFGGHHGMIVPDELDPTNHVLAFWGTNAGGDVYGTPVPVAQGKRYVLSFRYRGVPPYGPQTAAGYIGVSEDTPGRHRWLAGTVFCCGAESDQLVDDGQWRSYRIEFDPFAEGLPGQAYSFATFPAATALRVMIEDFSGVGGVPGDAFFDDVRLAPLALPVAIVVQPPGGGCIHNDGKGVFPVAILGSAEVAADQVVPESVAFQGLAVKAVGKGYLAHLEDVNADGILDLMVQIQDLDGTFTSGTATATLTATLRDGTPIEGSSQICVVP